MAIYLFYFDTKEKLAEKARVGTMQGEEKTAYHAKKQIKKRIFEDAKLRLGESGHWNVKCVRYNSNISVACIAKYLFICSFECKNASENGYK